MKNKSLLTAATMALLATVGCLRTPGGVEFKAGTGLSDHEREHPPAIGTMVTYRYQELSADNVPRFPVYVAARTYE